MPYFHSWQAHDQIICLLPWGLESVSVILCIFSKSAFNPLRRPRPPASHASEFLQSTSAYNLLTFVIKPHIIGTT
jgi:hypothetical protein